MGLLLQGVAQPVIFLNLDGFYYDSDLLANNYNNTQYSLIDHVLELQLRSFIFLCEAEMYF